MKTRLGICLAVGYGYLTWRRYVFALTPQARLDVLLCKRYAPTGYFLFTFAVVLRRSFPLGVLFALPSNAALLTWTVARVEWDVSEGGEPFLPES